MKRLPSGFFSRTAATTRILGRLGVSGARRLLGDDPEEDRALGEALFAELDRMKGMAMKVGQILSYLDVGLPEGTRKRLARLQEGAEPYSAEAIRAVVEEELGAPVDTLFEGFEDVPVAAASIGQVHRALVDGEPVAVKVRYPDIDATIRSDFGRLGTLGRIASLGTAVDGVALVEELRSRMLEECDYTLEAANQRLFGSILAGDPGLLVPQVIDSHCSKGVLTTAWHDGVGFGALSALSCKEVAATHLFRFPWVTLFGHGVLQADPHPGNFRFHPGGTVTALDYGCVRRFTPDQIDGFAELGRVVLHDRRAGLADALVRVGLAPDVDQLDMDGMWAMMRWMFAPMLPDTFHFDGSWMASGIHFTRPGNRNLRHQGLPPYWLWLQRAQTGLFSVLGRTGVTLPARRLFLESLG